MPLGDEAAKRNTRTDQRSVQRPTPPAAPVDPSETTETNTSNTVDNNNQ